MKILKKIGIIIGVLFIVYIVLSLMSPSGYKVTREIKISSPVENVFNQTTVFANWANWSAWAAADPEAIYTIENDNQIVGASMAWVGEISGKGKMTTTEVVKNESFIYDLHFIEPFEMTSHGGFLYEKEGEFTKLTWYDEGKFGFMIRPMMLFMNVEEEIGPMFEQGLEGIKQICESTSLKSAVEITEEIIEGHPILFIAESSSIMPDVIGEKIGAAFGELMSLIGIAKLEMVGMPISITKGYSLADMTCEFSPAIRLAELPENLELSGRIEKGESYSGKALKIVHTGSYETLKSTYDAIIAHIENNGIERNGDSFEEYVDDPTTVASEEVRTFIFFPIK
jgi:GyrI-like small molecule binding domain